MLEKSCSVPCGARQQIAPARWREFQHYGDRRPPWIKLHRELLNDLPFMALPLSAKGFAAMLWLLACEDPDGLIDAQPEYLTFRLRMSTKEVVDGLKHLLDSGLFVVASNVLASASSALAFAPGSVSVSPSVSVPLRGTADGTEGTGIVEPTTKVAKAELVEWFEELWKVYDRPTEKKAALAAYLELRPDADTAGTILMWARQYVLETEQKYRKHLHRWLKGRCWEDRSGLPPFLATTNGRAS